MFGKYVQQRNEIGAKFPFLLEETGKFKENSGETLYSLISNYTQEEVIKKNLNNRPFSGVNYSENSSECFDQMLTNLLNYFLDYNEQVATRPKTMLTSEQNAVVKMSEFYKSKLLLVKNEPSQVKDKRLKLIREEIFSNIDMSQEISKVLYLEAVTNGLMALDDVQILENLIVSHEEQTASISKTAYEKIRFQFKTPLTKNPNKQKIQNLEINARLYSPGFFSPLGELHVLNWFTFCDKFQQLQKDSFFIRDVCLYEPFVLNNRLSQKYFDYLEKHSLLIENK